MVIEREIIDPKLAKALGEIEAVLKKHKIAGHVAVASSTHGAYRLVFPDWSGIQLTEKGVHVKMRSEEHERSVASVNMLLSLRDMVTMQSMFLVEMSDTVLNALKEHGIEVDHELFGGPEPSPDT